MTCHPESLRRDYLTQFEDVLKNAVHDAAPDVFYWPSSPSSGGGFDNPNDENRGDVHYWDVWHGNKPFTAYALDSETMARWEHIIAVRTVVNGALEEARAAKVIGKSLEADVHLTVPEGDVFLADENPAALADLFIVSKVELTVGGELAVKVENAAGTKCPRCWKHSLTPNAEGLCPRCAEVVRHLPDLL